MLECLPPSQKQFFCLDFWLCVVSECTFSYNGYQNYKKKFFFYSFFASEVLWKESCCFSLITAPKELIFCIVGCCLFNTTTRTVLQVQCQTPTSKDVQFFLDVLFQYREPQTSMGGYVYTFFFFLSLEREDLPWEVRSKSSARNLG